MDNQQYVQFKVMIKRCNDCSYINICHLVDKITSGKVVCYKTTAKRCLNCTDKCDKYMKIPRYTQCPKYIKPKVSRNRKDRNKLLVEHYKNSRFQLLALDEFTTPSLFNFKCKVCDHEFTIGSDQLRLNRIITCPNLGCKSRRYDNYSIDRLNKLKESFSYRYDILDDEVTDPNQYVTFKCKSCGIEFKKLYKNLRLGGTSKFSCPNKLCNSKYRSTYETKISDYLKDHNIHHLTNDRSILENNKELDIYVPDYKIAIEIDGHYYHNNVNNYYKYLECKSKGIRLIQLTDFNMYDDSLLHRYLNSIFDYRISISGEVRKITKDVAYRFISLNQIVIPKLYDNYLALYDNNTITDLLTYEIVGEIVYFRLINNFDYTNRDSLNTLMSNLPLENITKLITYCYKSLESFNYSDYNIIHDTGPQSYNYEGYTLYNYGIYTLEKDLGGS